MRVLAIARPGRFQGFIPQWFGMPGYHLLVWEEGSAARNALFTTSVTDREFLEALRSLGVAPGPGLPMNTWESRRDLRSTDPDRYVEGPPLSIFVSWDAQPEPLEMKHLLSDTGSKGLDFRLAGNETNIKTWKSGCGICLYSCPGGKIANATYTVRDYVRGTTQFRVTNRFPPAGTPVTLIVRLTDASGTIK